VNNGFGVQIFESFDDSINKGLNLRCGEKVSNFDHFVERLVLTELQKDINIIFVFKVMVKLNNVLMVQGFMQSDLIQKLNYNKFYSQFCFLRGEQLFFNNFGSGFFVSLNVLSHKTMCKSAFT
jgi:hypothetical protein